MNKRLTAAPAKGWRERLLPILFWLLVWEGAAKDRYLRLEDRGETLALSCSQEELEVLEQQDLELEVLVYLGVPGSILAGMLGISWVFMERNLKVPPMEVMSMRE